MWKFANIEVKNKVVLAPMAGVTFYSYRKFMSQFDVGLFYSEMVVHIRVVEVQYFYAAFPQGYCGGVGVQFYCAGVVVYGVFPVVASSVCISQYVISHILQFVRLVVCQFFQFLYCILYSALFKQCFGRFYVFCAYHVFLCF